MNKAEKYIQVQVLAILEERQDRSPIVLLYDKAGNRILPILIGEMEANAIMISLHKVPTPRPLTHRLMHHIINKLQAKIEKVLITKLENNTFFAEIYLTKNQETIKLDARPSDAIALGLDCDAILYVSEQVINEVGQTNPFTPDMIMQLLGMYISELKSAKDTISGSAKFSNLTAEELEKLKDVLRKAREREEGSMP